MNREKRGWSALLASYILAILNLAGIWIAGIICSGTYLLAFYDLYTVYEIQGATEQ